MKYLWAIPAVLLICTAVVVYMFEQARSFHVGAHRMLTKAADDFWAPRPVAPPEYPDDCCGGCGRNAGHDADCPSVCPDDEYWPFRTESIEIPRDGRTET